MMPAGALRRGDPQHELLHTADLQTADGVNDPERRVCRPRLAGFAPEGRANLAL
jgi:hypothetical protein